MQHTSPRRTAATVLIVGVDPQDAGQIRESLGTDAAIPTRISRTAKALTPSVAFAQQWWSWALTLILARPLPWARPSKLSTLNWQ